ncbi:MAG: extracellular solute-binding protein [Eubacteriales bacterium]|nr:extracellular solute-binding protein [Eubacteriales bacterium]
MKKRILGAVLAAMMAVSMVGTTTVFAEEDYALTDAKFDDVQLKLYLQMNDTANGYFQEKIDEFNKLDNGITVEITNIATEADYLDRLAADFAGNSAPNVFLEYGGSRVIDYMDSDALVNLQPYLEADEEWYNGFQESAWEPAHYEDYGYEGLYAVPFTNYQILFFSNTEILDQYDLEVPSTWEEFLDACAVLKENGVQPLIVGEKDDYRFGHLHTVLSLKTYGPEVGKLLGSREMAYDGEEMLKIYGMIQELIDKGYLGDNLLSTDANQENSAFTNGECAFQFQGSWRAGSLASSESDLYANKSITVSRFPSVTEEYAKVDMGGGNESFFVWKLGKSEEEVAASIVLLKYITSVDFCDGLQEISPNTMAIKTTVETDNYVLNDIMSIMSETEAIVGDLQNYDTQSHMINTVRSGLQSLAMGNTPEEVGAQIIDTMSQYE